MGHFRSKIGLVNEIKAFVAWFWQRIFTFILGNVILQTLLGDPTATIEPSITPLKQKQYISDTISDTMKGNISNFVGKKRKDNLNINSHFFISKFWCKKWSYFE